MIERIDKMLAMYESGAIDHFCVGVENFDADKALAHLQQQYPASKPNIAGDKEVYLTDPDGIRLQLADINLKL